LRSAGQWGVLTTTTARRDRSPRRLSHSGRHAALLLVLLAAAPASFAGIDHVLPYDDSGIWNRKYQETLEYGLIAGEIIAGVWEGGESRFGRTMWQSIDASAGAGVVSFVMKKAFSRVRPRDSGGDPNLWFKGDGNESFPSGEVTAVSAIITPPVLEYGPENHWVYLLELLPLYDAIARMKVQAHWQTDVIAGFALGTAAGWLSHGNDHPYILRVMPHAIYVGLKKQW